MARLLSDENFPEPVVEALRGLGHDVLTLSQIGHAGVAVPDEQVLKLAVEESRAVVTLNRRHFIRLHETDSRHPGIVVCTFDQDFAGQAKRIHQALVDCGELAGRLLRVNRPSRA